MPTISRFYGIVVAMYFGDHPPAHFHAWYGGDKGRIVVASGDPIDGTLPPRVLRLLKQWTELRRRQLDANWKRAVAEQPLVPIEPLP